MIARKIMLLGEIGVGKSSLVRRLVFDRFEIEYKPTIGVDVYRYVVPDEPGKPGMNLIVWDTDGNFSDALFRHVYMKQASAAVIVGDISRLDTLDSMVKLARGFSEALPGRYVAHVVNKMDLLKEGEAPQLPQALLEPQRNVVETSALLGMNVRRCFEEIALAIIRRGL